MGNRITLLGGAALLMALLGLALVSSVAHADTQMTTHFIVPVDPYAVPPFTPTVDMVATVTWNSAISMYHYDYSIDYRYAYDPTDIWSYLPLARLSVGNVNNLNMSNPACSSSAFSSFTRTSNSLVWSSPGGGVEPNTTVDFSYDSIYGPTAVLVTAGSGDWADTRTTLGMVVPEPASLALLAMGASGVLAGIRRRRR